MASASVPSQGSEAKIGKILGLDLRSSRSQLDEGRCDRNFGFYPDRTGQASRMPGKRLLRVFENGDTPLAVTACSQLFDGTNDVLWRAGDQLARYSLDEMFNRVTPFNLTPTPPASSLGSYVLLAHQESNNTDGGSLGASNNNFYAGKVNTLLSDADGVVQAVTGNSFTIGLGTYTVDAAVSFGQTNNASSGLTMCRAGLFSVTNNAFKTYLGTSTEILSTSGRAPQWANGNQTNNLLYIKGIFEVTLASETLTISMAGASPFAWASASYAQGSTETSVVTGKPERYKIIKLVKIA